MARLQGLMILTAILSVAGAACAETTRPPPKEGSWLPTGKRMHKPFVITKALDRTKLQMACDTLGGTVVSNGRQLGCVADAGRGGTVEVACARAILSLPGAACGPAK